MPDTQKRPLVGVVTELSITHGVQHNSVRRRYIEALIDAAGVTPVLLPCEYAQDDANSIASRMDGIVLTGSLSNIDPVRYGELCTFDNDLLDLPRDTMSSALITACLTFGRPLLGICRGMQELNVAFGGTLHQSLQSIPVRHYEDLSLSRDEQFGPSHTVRICEGGILSEVLSHNLTADIYVNSLHLQGIKDLGTGLRVEALAADNLVEAISVIDSPAPIFAVQWHPEWHYKSDRISQALFGAYGTFCRLISNRTPLRS